MKQSFAIPFALTFMVLVGLGSAASFDIQLSEDTASSCPCTANSISVKVENLYRDADTIMLSLELPKGWSGFVQPDVMLGSGESDIVHVYITPTDCNMEPGSYTATLDAESAMTGDQISETISVTTLKCHFVSIDVGETYREICQETSEGKVFGVIVSNEGKYTETFSLRTDTEWAHFSHDSLEIDGGEEKTVQLVLTPPEDVLNLETIALSAESDVSYAKTSETVNVNVVNCYDFEASLTPAAAGVETGDSVTLPTVSIAEPSEPGEPSVTGGVTGAAAAEDEYPWESMIVAVIIVIVVLVIIYIVVRG